MLNGAGARASATHDDGLARATLPPVSAETVPTGNTYDKYATRNPIERRLMAGFLRELDKALPVGEVRRVLEVGTGEGHIAARIRARYPYADVIGLDLPDDELGAQWHNDGLAGVFGSADRLPFPDASFDLVMGIEMLEHVAAPEVVVREIARVSKQHVVLTVPWEPWWREIGRAHV